MIGQQSATAHCDDGPSALGSALRPDQSDERRYLLLLLRAVRRYGSLSSCGEDLVVCSILDLSSCYNQAWSSCSISAQGVPGLHG